MRLFRRKPKFTHPCHVCERAGRVHPHGGQHPVAYAPVPSRTAAEALGRLGLTMEEFYEHIMRDREG